MDSQHKAVLLVALLAIAQRNSVLSCGGGSSSSSPGVVTQDTFPLNPVAIKSSCGHSMYYYYQNNPGDAIIGGQTALPNQYPWLVRLSVDEGTESKKLCQAVIISDSFLLTTVYCVPKVSVTAFFGDHDTTKVDNGEFNMSIPITNFFIHPNYDSVVLNYDLALLKLDSPLSFSNWTVQKICLPASCSECHDGDTAFVAGWGYTKDQGSLSTTLQHAYLQLMPFDTCANKFAGIEGGLGDANTCAGRYGGGVGTCIGDSAVPLMINKNGYYKLCGIRAYIIDCIDFSSFPTVFGNICKSRDWIQSIAGI